jgi:outer membrane protein assembly factor BamB
MKFIPRARPFLRILSVWLVILPTLGNSVAAAEPAGDWPQWGGSPMRNNVSKATGLPVQWKFGRIDRKTHAWSPTGAKNIKWVARLGNECYGTPVVVGSKVFCATNNGAGYLKRYPAETDLGCLLAFGREDGRFLWQYSAEKLKAGDDVDWPQQGICAAPLVEANRLWVVNNRGEVVCLDTEGAAAGEARLVWTFDMMRELGVVQRYMANCSVTAAGDLLLVGTSNGVGKKDRIPAPNAPSFIALDKRTGKLVWADSSPGRNLLEGQWSSPAYAVLGGAPQAIFAGGDGWLYSFLAQRTDDGKAKLLWKFDCNPKTSVWLSDAEGERNNIISTPVVCDGRVYIATGRDPQAGEGQGDLWCIDPLQRGDTSAELVVDSQGKPVVPQRTRALDKDAGQRAVPNPNSAAVWHYRGKEPPAAAAPTEGFEAIMHRTLGTLAVKDGLLVIGDMAGVVHCLDAKTGKVHWTHDMLSSTWGSPLLADGRIYLGNDDGDVVVFQFGTTLKLLAKNAMGETVSTTPVAVGNVLYVATHTHLFAISNER